jgi:hypothetical protein
VRTSTHEKGFALDKSRKRRRLWSVLGGKQGPINIRIPHDAYTLYWRTKTLKALRALSSLGQQ